SNALLSQSTLDTWDNLDATTVREAGCESCHRPHSAGGRQRLLRHEAEEVNCLNCHDGSAAQTDIASQLDRFSSHNSRLFTGVHDPTEDAQTMNKHVECADCHNPHTVSAAGQAQAPQVRPLMRNVRGMTGSGVPVAQAQFEYQVCYKCHSQQNFAQQKV